MFGGFILLVFFFMLVTAWIVLFFFSYLLRMRRRTEQADTASTTKNANTWDSLRYALLAFLMAYMLFLFSYGVIDLDQDNSPEAVAERENSPQYKWDQLQTFLFAYGFSAAVLFPIWKLERAIIGVARPKPEENSDPEPT